MEARQQNKVSPVEPLRLIEMGDDLNLVGGLFCTVGGALFAIGNELKIRGIDMQIENIISEPKGEYEKSQIQGLYKLELLRLQQQIDDAVQRVSNLLKSFDQGDE